jgi:hypothetical protein
MREKRIDAEESATDREIAFRRVTSALVLVLVILFGITTPWTEDRSIWFSIRGTHGSFGSPGGGDASMRSEGECVESSEVTRISQAMPQEFDTPRTMVWEAWTDSKHFEITATFGDEGGKTRVTMRMVFVPAAARDQKVWEYGSIEGGKQTLERLVEHLSARFVAKNEEE